MLLLKKQFLSILEEHTYFVKINPKKVSDSKNFWKHLSPLFSENGKIKK